MASTTVARAPTEAWLDCERGSLALADLHLHPASEPRLEPFLAWLGRLAGVPRLCLLGDLFDVWVGPSQARAPAAARVIEALGELVRRGTAVELVPGNRDFLLDASFERASGVRLWPEGLRLRLPGGERALLVHGDELCTADHAYQRMKRVLRSAPVRGLARHLPHAVARWAGARLRQRSQQAVAAKLPEEKSMQVAALRGLAERHGAELVVCGHAHEHRDERLPGGPRWVVLDAWGGPRDLLVLGQGEGGGIAARASASYPAPPERRP